MVFGTMYVHYGKEQGFAFFPLIHRAPDVLDTGTGLSAVYTIMTKT
jgi:hypothetical protein